MRPRILYIENGLGFGGATRCLYSLVRAALRHDYEPFVAISYADPDLTERLDEQHIIDIRPFRRFGAAAEPPDANGRWTAGLAGKMVGTTRNLLNAAARDVPLTRFLKKQIKAHDINIVHTNNGLLANRAEIEAASQAGVPLVATVRGWEWPCHRTRNLARLPWCIVAVSEAVRRDLLRVGAPQDAVICLYDGIDLKQFTPDPHRGAVLRQELGFRQQDIVVGLVATLLPWKGHDVYLKALHMLSRSHDAIRGLVVGGRPANAAPMSPPPAETARHLNIADRITFLDHVLDPQNIYAACDIVVHTSKRPEPFGLVVIEAMACGRPVVATQEGGPAETILDHQTGLLYPLGDHVALARAIGTLVSDHQLRDRLGQAARKHAQRHFDERRNIDGYFDLYSRIAAATSAAQWCD
ncbi:MAG: glycosyltransferase [Phycisphaerales bacterium]|nr:MAG: glycosyltransferase [Phycisphaerales bacterium]